MNTHLMQSPEILIADDTRDHLRLLTQVLTDSGYDVRPVSSGTKALSAARANPPDLILLDIMMPDMNGYDVCRHLKADERLRDIPVIFLSALDELGNKLQGFEAGGVDYITKPFSEEDVLARVGIHVQLLRQQREIQRQQERFERLAEATFEGILIHDQGRIVEVNSALEALSGYSRADLIGRDAFELLPPESRDIAAAQMQTDNERPYELWITTRDGARVPVEVQGKTLRTPDGMFRVLAMRDISWRHVFQQEQRALKIELEGRKQFGKLVGNSQPMRTVYEQILRAAASDAPVMIYGETGTGKELTARTIFELSDHHARAFVAVNCASIPENLFESQFFGHRKGAFTGADAHHAGFFEQAQGGALFLDEVGELPLAMQAKLLRVLEDHVYTPVGGRQSRQADVRILAATNKELRSLVQDGAMRSDFFYRLHVLAIDLPPLRRHSEDIPLLAAHFLSQCAESQSSPVPPHLPPEVLDRFLAYAWPGNVRELLNEVRRYCATGQVELSGHLTEDRAAESTLPHIPDDLSLADAVECFEQYYIPRTLQRHNGHKRHTADILRVDRKTLYRKLKRYGIDD